MPYVETFDRNQMMLCSWGDFVEEESTARLIDVFVNSLNLTEYNVKEVATEGRPSYDPKGLFKLYIYGYRNDIRSSRKLAKSCKVNLEVKWMLGGVEPDFRTISDFRKTNIDALKKIFRDFNRRISNAVEWGFVSVDGSKFQACNSRNNNFTKNKLDDRIKWLNGHIDEYLRILNETDEQDNTNTLTKEMIEAKLAEAKARLAKYEAYQQLMETNGLSQLSLVDADAMLMKSKNGFIVAYNPQTAVDSNTHLIRDYEMTNQVTDHGLLSPTLANIKAENETDIMEAVADKGYEDSADIVKCLEQGIIPHVIADDGKDGYALKIPYEAADVDISSKAPEELSRSLHAGIIPNAYRDVIEKIKVIEVRRLDKTSDAVKSTPQSPYGTPEEMKARAREGYFVRDPERNLVYCPNGEIMRQKCIVKSNGNIRYSNKTACRHCPDRNKCYKGLSEWKEIDFTKDKLEKPCKGWCTEEETVSECVEEPKRKRNFKKMKMVSFFFRPNREKTAKRMCLSEHPFGTIKRAMGATYFLLKGLKKVAGEFALFCLAYNIERAKNLLGFRKLMSLMSAA